MAVYKISEEAKEDLRRIYKYAAFFWVCELH